MDKEEIIEKLEKFFMLGKLMKILLLKWIIIMIIKF